MKKIEIQTNMSPYPTPIALVGATINGKANFMTVGSINRINLEPPILAIGINKNHYTTQGIIETKTFSVNFPNAALIEKTDYCGLYSGREIDKAILFDLFYGKLGVAPMIKECYLCLECKVTEIIELPTNYAVFGEIVSAYTEDRYLTNSILDMKKINPVVLTVPDRNYWLVGDNLGEAWKIGEKYRLKINE